MAIMKDNLPLTMDEDMEQSSSITYASDVVATIAGIAAGEVEGIAGMCNVSGNILGKNRNITKGVKVEIGTEEASVDLYVVIEYGTPIQKAALDAQENVRKAIESMTDLHVVRVDVHVQGVSFEKENSAISAGSQVLLENEPAAEPAAEPVAEEPVAEAEPVAEESVADEAAPETEEDTEA